MNLEKSTNGLAVTRGLFLAYSYGLTAIGNGGIGIWSFFCSIAAHQSINTQSLHAHDKNVWSQSKAIEEIALRSFTSKL